MKRFILPLMLLFVVFFITSCATIDDYTIDGDTVWIESADIGKIKVTPHTCNDIFGNCCQEANITSYLNTQDLDVAFKFDIPITGKIYKWVNHSHEIDNWTEVCESEFINDTWLDICERVNNPYEAHNFSWLDVTSYMEHTEYQNKHYYMAPDINFIEDKEYQFKWCYNAPTISGKWDLLAKRSSDTIQEVYDSGNFIMLDPWWESATRYEYYYDSMDNAEWINLGGESGANQLFTVGTVGDNVAHTAQGVQLLFGDYGDNGDYINVYIVDANSTGDGCDWDSIVCERLNFDISPVNGNGYSPGTYLNVTFSVNGTLNAGNKYCLVVNSTTVSEIGVRSDRTGPSYTGGYIVWRHDGAMKTGYDMYFGIWGTALESTLDIHSVNITPVTAYYNTPLNCSVNYTSPNAGDLFNINFTWLKDGVSNYSYDTWVTNQPGGTGVIVYSPTRVDSLVSQENWTCVAYVVNNTNDDSNATSQTSIIISSTPPSFDYALNWSDYHNVNVSLDYNCSDLDGDSINYTILNLTNNFNTDLTINLSTGIISYDPIQNETGERLFNVTCFDGTTNVTSWLNITILNRAPSTPTTALANNSVFANTYNLTCNSSTDPESDTIYYQFWNTTNNLQNSTNTTYYLDVIGDTIWRCRACDYVDDSQSYAECSNYTEYLTTTLYSFTNCTGANASLFFRYKDEDTGSYILASHKSNLQLTSPTGTEQEFLFDLPIAANHSYCLTGLSSTTISTGMIEYYNSTYDARNYYFYEAEITNVTQNLTLYLLPSTLATGITINVEDESGEALEGYTVYVERYSVETNSYTLIAMGRTDTNGQDVIFLRGGTADTGDVWYRFKVYYHGTLLKTTLSQKVISTSVTLRLGESDWIEHQEELEDVIVDLSFNEGTYTFSLDYSTVSGLPRNVCLDVYEQRPGGYVYQLNHTCETAASGLMLYTLPTTIHNYKAVAYVTGSAPENKAILYWRNVTNVFGNTGILLTVGLIILLSLIGAFSPIAAIVFGTIGLVISSMIGLITVGQIVVTTVVVLAIIMIMKLGRENL